MFAPKIGLALGAGGARGLTHIGVIKGLRRHGIPIHGIAGSSIGALVGAMYAATLDIDWVQQRFRDMLTSESFTQSGIQWVKDNPPDSDPGFFEWAAQYVRHRLMLNFSDSRPGIVKTERLGQLIAYLLPVTAFNDLKIPFACATVDLHSGNDVILDSGDLVEAVTASSAMPGYVAPLAFPQGLLVDGGTASPVPFAAARRVGSDFIIAVDISIQNFPPLPDHNILNILGRASEIATARLIQAQQHQWDYCLRPDTLNLHWTRFEKLTDLVASGEEVLERELPNLRRKLKAATGIKGLIARKRARK